MKQFLLNRLFFEIARVARSNFVRQTRNTATVQNQFLLQFIYDHRNTVLGQELGLDQIKDADAFRSKIPVLPYNHYRPFIDRIWKGEQNVMNPDPVIFLTVSSATTGKRKLTPVTRRSHKIRNRARRASTGFFGSAIKQQNLKIGPILLTNTATIIERTDSGVPVGAASAIDLILNQRSYRGRNLFPYPYDAFLIENNVVRHYVCLLFALQEVGLRIISGNFPTFVLNAAVMLERFQDFLVDDVERGTFADWVELPDLVRANLGQVLRPDPARAKQLRHIIEKTGRLTPQAIWPDLTAVVTARGAPSYHYFRKFPEYFGEIPVFGGIYGAAEAIYGIYHDFDNDEAVLPVNTAFFEFVPESEWDKEFPNTLLPSETQAGHLYRVLVTNYAGFYRYDSGDIVKVLGTYEGAPTLTFIRRKGGQLSSISEKTTEWHVDQAMGRLQDRFGITLEDYCVALAEDTFPPHYLLNVELRPNETLPNPVEIIDAFDQILKEVQDRYRARRIDYIPPPRLRILAPGSFAKLRASLISTPGSDTNIKPRHLAENRSYLADLTVLEEIQSSH